VEEDDKSRELLFKISKPCPGKQTEVWKASRSVPFAPPRYTG
jgi:hypothetical protein